MDVRFIDTRKDRNLDTIVSSFAAGVAATVIGGPELTSYSYELVHNVVGSNALFDVLGNFIQQTIKEEDFLKQLVMNLVVGFVYVVPPVTTALAVPKLLYDKFRKKRDDFEPYNKMFRENLETMSEEDARYDSLRCLVADKLAEDLKYEDVERIKKELDGFIEAEVNRAIIKGEHKYYMRNYSLTEDDFMLSHRERVLKNLWEYASLNSFKGRLKHNGGVHVFYEALGKASIAAMPVYAFTKSMGGSLCLGIIAGALLTRKRTKGISKYGLLGRHKHEAYQRFVKRLDI